MIVFLSTSFLRRLQLSWKPDLKAFLIGERNLYFFTPEAVFETAEITPQAVDAFLKNNLTQDHWQLLGFLQPEQSSPMPGYVQISTQREADPKQWSACLYLLEEKGAELRNVEIRCSGAE
jgi:hypothetical protein